MDEEMFAGFLDDPIDGFINKYKSKFGDATDYYSNEVQPSRTGNDPGNQDQYGIRNQKSTERDVQNIQDQGGRLSEYIFGSTQPLSEAEKQEMSEMEQREARLQPVDFGVLGGQRIAGNPFSIDTRGLMTGLGNLGAGLINRERGKRRGEFSEDLQSMREQEAENQAIEQGQQNFLSEFVPQSYFNQKAEEAKTRSSNRDFQQSKELEQLRQQGSKDLATLRSNLQKQVGTGKAKDYSSQVVQQYFKAAYPEFYNMQSALDSYLRTRETLNEQLNEATTDSNKQALNAEIRSIDSAIGSIQEQTSDLGTKMASEMINMGVVPPSAIFEGRLQEQGSQGGGGDSTGEDLSYTDAEIEAYAEETGMSIEDARQAFQEDIGQ